MKRWLKPIPYIIDSSEIHGLGVICTIPIKRHDIIGVAIVRTPSGPVITEWLGRFVNHSDEPNAFLFNIDNHVWELKALRIIKPGEEITADYSDPQGPDFLQQPEDFL